MRDFLESVVNGGFRDALAPLASENIAQLSLNALAPVRVAIPTGARYVSFAFEDHFRAKFGDASVEASLGTVVGTGNNSTLNPTTRRIPVGVTHISVIAKNGCEGSVEFWR